MKKFFTLIIVLVAAMSAFAQSIPELSFRNPVLVSGTAGQTGASYRFSNAASGIDALVAISGKSTASVVVNNIDKTSTGWDKAFQPELGFSGTVSANQSWWVEFNIQFVTSGTTNAVSISSFFATAIDIDGDGQSLREWAEMQKVKTVTLGAGSQLTANLLQTHTLGKDYKITSPVANRANIDTSSTDVMATYEYENKSTITMRLGAMTGGNSTTAGMRMNSIWFKQFQLNYTLPVTLASFSAIARDAKADLQWVTSSEINVSHFVVEKSFDGRQYADAAIVFAYGSAAGEARYQYFDNLATVTSPVVYYRLRSVDQDGKVQYSETRMIRLAAQPETGIRVTTYPNPVTSTLQVSIPEGWQGKAVSYELYAAGGQQVYKTQTAAASQTESIQIAFLKAGMYIVKVSCTGSTAIQKIIKQ